MSEKWNKLLVKGLVSQHSLADFIVCTTRAHRTEKRAGTFFIVQPPVLSPLVCFAQRSQLVQ